MPVETEWFALLSFSLQKMCLTSVICTDSDVTTKNLYLVVAQVQDEDAKVKFV
jgi:hypothetical protein